MKINHMAVDQYGHAQGAIPTQEELFSVRDRLAEEHDRLLETSNEEADKFLGEHPLLQYDSANYRELMAIGKAEPEPALQILQCGADSC